ncbi:MAG: DUF2330 domain-containing protein [Bradymonadia bacterium]
MWPRLTVLAVLLGIGLRAETAEAIIIAPSPGQEVVAIEERVLLVFDPLKGSQTVVIQHTFEGTTAPFGLLIPTPEPAKVSLGTERLGRAIRNKLHPRARDQRILDVEFVWWTKSCVIREVGDGHAGQGRARKPPMARGKAEALGPASDRLHEWLLNKGFTLAPAQAAWLNRLRDRGWSVVAVEVRPKAPKGLPAARIRGPILAMTHEAEEPIYASAQPPFDIDGAVAAPTPLEIGVLTEWAVSPDTDMSGEPFFADALSGRDVSRLGTEAGGLPWAFRRDGTLTAYRFDRGQVPSVLRFVQSPPRPRIRPKAEPQIKAHSMQLPVELPLLGGIFGIWAWMRLRNGRRVVRGTRSGRLRL